MSSFTPQVGKSHSWSVDVIGEPITDKTWCIKEGVNLENNEKITITNADYNTTFEIKDAVRKDTAKYKVRAENENGYDEEWVELVVLGKSFIAQHERATYLSIRLLEPI